MCGYDYAPSEAVCLRCGSLCVRRATRLRTLKDISLDSSQIIKVKVGDYRCKKCNKYFRSQPDFVEKGKHYTERAINKVYTAIQEDKTTFTGVTKRVERDFKIKPSKSTCHDWFHRKAGRIDLAKEYEPWIISTFSGALAIDEVFDGGKCTFFATDPLNNRTIAFHRSDFRDGEELRKFLERIKSMGVNPEVFLSDAAPVYASIPQEIWPNIKYQLCTFHFIRDCMKDMADTIRAFLKTLPKKAKQRDKKENPERYRFQLKESKHRKLIWEYRHIFLTRKANLSGEELMKLNYLCSKYPTLEALTKIKDGLLRLFSRENTRVEVTETVERIIANSACILEDKPPTEKIVKRLLSENFQKTLTFMDYENLDSTTNQVERTNRWFRKRQKTHYRNRKEQNIVNMLKADLIGQMERDKNKPPVKLKSKNGNQAIIQVA